MKPLMRESFIKYLKLKFQFNPLFPNSLIFLYPLKTSENMMFSGGRERVRWEQMGSCDKTVEPIVTLSERYHCVSYKTFNFPS